MKKLRNLVVAVPFCFALLTPVVVAAAPGQDRDDHRYYDSDHKDYHQWDANEDRYYHQYWKDEHKHYIAWERASDEQRRDYWRWRHEHEHGHDHDHDR